MAITVFFRISFWNLKVRSSISSFIINQSFDKAKERMTLLHAYVMNKEKEAERSKDLSQLDTPSN